MFTCKTFFICFCLFFMFLDFSGELFIFNVTIYFTLAPGFAKQSICRRTVTELHRGSLCRRANGFDGSDIGTHTCQVRPFYAFLCWERNSKSRLKTGVFFFWVKHRQEGEQEDMQLLSTCAKLMDGLKKKLESLERQYEAVKHLLHVLALWVHR